MLYSEKLKLKRREIIALHWNNGVRLIQVCVGETEIIIKYEIMAMGNY